MKIKNLLRKGYCRKKDCSIDVTYFMCSDPSNMKMEMKSLLERFPFGKNRNIYFRIRFVLFLTSGDGSIALSV